MWVAGAPESQEDGEEKLAARCALRRVAPDHSIVSHRPNASVSSSVHACPSSTVHALPLLRGQYAVELLRRDYTANGGRETFLSYEDPERDILVGLLRLRKCSDEGTFRLELVRRPEGGCSIVRELHVYGTAVPVHGRDPTKFQHQVR